MFQTLRTLSGLLTLALLASLPLEAQLNPRWQTSNSPDFLNLYQQSIHYKVKPEIVTVLDFSGSMSALMYHKNYDNQDLNDNYPSQRGAWISFVRSGTSYLNYNVVANINDLQTAGGSTFSLTSGQLIRPDGTLLTASLVNSNYQWQGLSGEPASGYTKRTSDSSTWPSSRVQNWVRSASHARFTYNGRTIDIPIPWTILDDFSVQPNEAKRDTRKMYNTYPLKMTIQDPVTKTEVEMDAIYRHGSSVITGGSQSSCTLYTDPSQFTRTYPGPYIQWIFSGAIPGSGTAFAFKNGLPARTRVQGVKEALLRTWIKYHDKVYWAFRGLQSSNDSTGSRENSQGTSIFTDSRRGEQGGDPVVNDVYGNRLRKLVLMNDNSLEKMTMISHLFHGGGTPLTYAAGNAYAQFNDPNSVFNDVYRNGIEPQECTYHFMILFTDGQPNSDGGGENLNSPYLNTSKLTGSASDGNSVINSNLNSMNPNGINWNIINLSAVSAHLGDIRDAPNYPSSDWSSKSGGRTPAALLPFWINERAGKSLAFKNHPIRTMTVGVSLAGTYTGTTGGKPRLFRAAAFGDPRRKEWDLNQLKPFTMVEDPADPNYGKKDPNSVNFFDAADPQQLVEYLDKAFYEATTTAGNTSTTAPVLPTLGAGLGTQVYLAQFTPPEPSKSGPVWSGDLMMFPTKEVNGQTKIVDGGGSEIVGALTREKARWAASSILQDKGWKNRVVYTRLPATSAESNPPLVRVDVSGTTPADDPGFKAIRDLLPGTDDAAKLAGWKFLVGAGADGVSTRESIMGDIINSTPAVVAYTELPATVASASTKLSNAWATATGEGKSGRQFSLILVGDNQGFVHGFGEVSWNVVVPQASGGQVKITQGIADELWAFVPTDLLPHINYLQQSSNPHRYGVDGSPTVYLLDRPGVGQTTGNGKYDVGSKVEDALAIIGLGKGGRSYYALDVRDPAAPSLRWTLCPDEPDSYPAGRFLQDSGSRAAIGKMGYATAIPTPARLLWGDPLLVRDFIFIGGGYSVPEIEKDFPTAGANTKLGRLAVALEVSTGNIARVWDFSGVDGMGPIPGGIIPYEFVRGSGLHTRAYFTDFFGGLWALGSSGASDAAATKGFRVDTPKLSAWSTTARALFKQAPNNGLVSTWPVPFSLPSPMPARATDPKTSPAAVGVAWVTGDRMNPLDQLYTSTNTMPTQHRLNVFFDRQDSSLLGLDAAGASDGQMADFSNQTDPNAQALDPANTNYFLKTKYGYYINFPATSKPAQFTAKGMIPPQLLAGSLFFSAFLPTEADPCAGGQGETNTYRLCEVMRPVFSKGDAGSATGVNGCKSGLTLVFSGVASRFAARSPVAVMQAGVNPVSKEGSGSGTGSVGLQVKTIMGSMENRFIRPRVWRTVR